MYLLSRPEVERILQLNLSKAVPDKDIMFCEDCDEEYEPGEVGPTLCGSCDGVMRYVRFHTQQEIEEWQQRKAQFER